MSLRPFRFGLLSAAGDAEQWRRDVALAEANGYSSIVLTDHLDLSGAHVTRLSWLPAFADALARTTTLHATVMVANQDLRHPAVLARDVTTLDRLSGGRIELGIGAGWVEQEYAWAGLRYDPAPVRIDRLEEYVAVVRGLTTAGTPENPEPFSFSGAHFTIDRMPRAPLPTHGRLPLMVGGEKPRVLRLAGRVADTVNLNVLRDDRPADEVLAEKVGWVIAGAAERAPGIERGELASDTPELGMSIPLIAGGLGSPEDAVERAKGEDPFAARVASRVPTARAARAAYTLAGTTETMVARLLAHRETHGITQFVVPAKAADVMRPVLARLADC